MRISRIALLVAGVLFVGGFIASSCKDSSGNGSGNPGQAGATGGGNAGTTGNGGSTAGSGGSAGSAGSGGSRGGSGGMAGGTPGFMAIAPCLNESDYVSNTSTINFGLINGAYTYAPKCLKVAYPRGVAGSAGAPGTNVTFSGDFGTHPLMPSTNRGDQTGNPITPTSAVPDGGTTKTFYFGGFDMRFFAYFCQAHDPNDTGNFMSGVVWVVPQ